MLAFLMCTILKMAAVDCPDTETNVYQTQPHTVNLTIIVLLLTQNKPVADDCGSIHYRCEVFIPPQQCDPIQPPTNG